jgi:hypothetical protein
MIPYPESPSPGRRSSVHGSTGLPCRGPNAEAFGLLRLRTVFDNDCCCSSLVHVSNDGVGRETNYYINAPIMRE